MEQLSLPSFSSLLSTSSLMMRINELEHYPLQASPTFFFFVSDDEAKQAGAFVPTKLLQPFVYIFTDVEAK
jgi:hypothetical protein